MDVNRSIDHERLYNDERQSDRRKVYPYTPRTEWIPFGLLALLFALILALFIIAFSKANESKKLLITLKEMNDFRGKVHNLSMDMDQLHTSLKKKTCEAGWKQFDDSCYSLTVSKASWSTTRSSCLKKGADLASITSEREQIFLKTYSDASSSKRYWIGLHDMDEEGSWTWVDGTDYETSYKQEAKKWGPKTSQQTSKKTKTAKTLPQQPQQHFLGAGTSAQRDGGGESDGGAVEEGPKREQQREQIHQDLVVQIRRSG